jgi:hypothetical protein
MTRKIKLNQPIIITFYHLSFALKAVHLFNTADIDNLHDVWLMGAPVPNSRVMQPKIYDPRIPQIKLGNYEARIVFPNALSKWIQDVLKRRGQEITVSQALRLVGAVSRAYSKPYGRGARRS